MTSGHQYVTRRARAAVVVEDAAPRSEVRVVEKMRGWTGLRGEVLGTFKRLGVVDFEDGGPAK